MASFGDAAGASTFGSAGAASSPTADNAAVTAASLIEMLTQDAASAAAAAAEAAAAATTTTAASSATDAHGKPGDTADLQARQRRGRGIARKHKAVEFKMEVHLLGDAPGDETIEFLQASVPAARLLAGSSKTKKATSDERPRRSAPGAPRAAVKRARLSEHDGVDGEGAPANSDGGGAGAGIGAGDEPVRDQLAVATQRYVGNLAVCENGVAPDHVQWHATVGTSRSFLIPAWPRHIPGLVQVQEAVYVARAGNAQGEITVRAYYATFPSL